MGGGFFSFIIGAFVGVIASLTQREAATGELVDQVCVHEARCVSRRDNTQQR